MGCDRYMELLALRLDGSLTDAEEGELEAHLSACPDCRAAGAQLAALQGAFHEWEEVPAPEGFAQGVMGRIRAEEPSRVIPLFKRPQFRALAGLAACAVLAVGLYGAVRQQEKAADAAAGEVLMRSFSRDAQVEELDVPEITAYCDPGAPIEGTDEAAPYEMQKAVPEADTYDGAAAIPVTPMVNQSVLTVDRLPEGEGMEELLLLEAYATPDEEGRVCMYVTEEKQRQVERLAVEQGITASITSGGEEAEEFIIVVLDEAE